MFPPLPPHASYADNSLPAPVSVTSPYERRAFEAYKTPNHRYLLVRRLEYQKSLPLSNSVAHTPSVNSHSATCPQSFFLGRRKTHKDVAGVFYDAQLDHPNALWRSSTNYAGHCRPPCPHPPRRSKPERRVWMTAILISVSYHSCVIYSFCPCLYLFLLPSMVFEIPYHLGSIRFSPY